MVLVSSLFKQNRGWIFGYSIGTSLYLFFLAAMFPAIQETGLIEAKLDSLPPELLELFKMDPNLSMENVMNILAGNYYGLIFYVLTILFALTFASRLMAKPVDSGEIMLYMAAPISRRSYVTSCLVLLFIAVGLFVGLNGSSLLLANILFDLEVDVSLLWLLQLNAALLLLVLGTFAYAVASLFEDSTRSYMVTGGILSVFLILNIFSGFSEKLEKLKWLSIFSLFDANALIQKDVSYSLLFWLMLLFLVTATFCYSRFTRKDLTV